MSAIWNEQLCCEITEVRWERRRNWQNCGPVWRVAFPARFCMYMGKPAVLDEISKSRDQLEEMEKYVVPDETGIRV